MRDEQATALHYVPLRSAHKVNIQVEMRRCSLSSFAFCKNSSKKNTLRFIVHVLAERAEKLDSAAITLLLCYQPIWFNAWEAQVSFAFITKSQGDFKNSPLKHFFSVI